MTDEHCNLKTMIFLSSMKFKTRFLLSLKSNMKLFQVIWLKMGRLGCQGGKENGTTDE